MESSTALQITDLTIRYDGRAVLKDFSMSLRAGEKALVAGPSGCGKSTVLRCVLGFTVPEAGSIHIQGKELTSHSVWSLRKHLAYVAQEPDLGAETIRSILEQPFHFRANASKHDNLERIGELFERFGLAQSLLDKEAGDLSGGEKQRVALIGAILLDRSIFLLDEATSALDKAGKQRVADYFRSRDDVTALIVAHDPEWFSFADQTIQVHPDDAGREQTP